MYFQRPIREGSRIDLCGKLCQAPCNLFATVRSSSPRDQVKLVPQLPHLPDHPLGTQYRGRIGDVARPYSGMTYQHSRQRDSP